VYLPFGVTKICPQRAIHNVARRAINLRDEKKEKKMEVQKVSFLAK
jgi:hypothetical protein